jgi:hypothetical protein
MSNVASVVSGFFFAFVGVLIGSAVFYIFTRKTPELSLILSCPAGVAVAQVAQIIWPLSTNYRAGVVGLSIGVCIVLGNLLVNKIGRQRDGDVWLR